MDAERGLLLHSEAEREEAEISSRILQLTSSFVASINSRNWDEAEAFKDYVAHDFTAEMRDWGYPKISSWDEYMATYRHIASLSPEWQVNNREAFVNVDLSWGKVEVYVLVELVGQPVGIKTLGSSMLTWRRAGGRWAVKKHLMFRSPELDAVE